MKNQMTYANQKLIKNSSLMNSKKKETLIKQYFTETLDGGIIKDFSESGHSTQLLHKSQSTTDINV